MRKEEGKYANKKLVTRRRHTAGKGNQKIEKWGNDTEKWKNNAKKNKQRCGRIAENRYENKQT